MQRTLELEAKYKYVLISLHTHIFVLDINTQGF